MIYNTHYDLNATNITRFVEKYENAKSHHHELFTFDGDLVTTDFAGYIIKQLSLTFENAVKAVLN